jgi:DNA (cytosine-5)-methyltransferase 1
LGVEKGITGPVESAMRFSCVELCAGGGGQALGLEMAGFDHRALVELDGHSVRTLRENRPEWNVVEADLHSWDPRPYRGVDLVAAGLPCPPFSIAGKQLGADDERNLFPRALEIIRLIGPKAIMIENVRGLLDAVFRDFREQFQSQVERLGYRASWRLLNASDFGVPQLRPRVVFAALKPHVAKQFNWPEPILVPAMTVGEVLYDMMAERGWRGVEQWKGNANEIAPTLVGGSRKHGGPDLGPTRAKKAWATLGVNGLVLANSAPDPDFIGMPKLTVQMCAVLQGFPKDWGFSGGKTAAYRQVGNAFPPPVARAVGLQIRSALIASARLSEAA